MSRGLRSRLRRVLVSLPIVGEAVFSARDRLRHAQLLREGTFAQHGEDRELLDALHARGAAGPYVDVGSNHPFHLSNSYLLYREGWRGVCIDPLSHLETLYRHWRPDDIFVSCAVGEGSGRVTLHEFEIGMLSTCDARAAADYVAAGYRLRRTVEVPVRRLDDVLEQLGVIASLSLLTVDVEGGELSVLRSLDLDRWRPEIVCLEVMTAVGKASDDAVHHLESRGYRVLRDLGLNVVMERVSSGEHALRSPMPGD